MIYKIGDLVRFKDKDGKNIVGTIRYFSRDDFLQKDFIALDTIFGEMYITKEDIISDETSCECGAEKLGHPGHSNWCKKSSSAIIKELCKGEIITVGDTKITTPVSGKYKIS